MNGIGGRTIAEAKRNISYPEFLEWVAFRNKRGSLHLGMRVEYGIAQLSALYANAHRKKDSPPVRTIDFMPHADQPVLTLDDLAAFVG